MAALSNSGQKKRQTFHSWPSFILKNARKFCANVHKIFGSFFAIHYRNAFLDTKTKNHSFSQHVEYVECVLGGFPKNVFLSALMLNMFIMLNVL